jgi:hypothetical protein
MTRLIGVLFACTLVLCAAAAPARAQECQGSVAEAEAVAAEDARYKAMMSGDAGALAKLLGDDLVYTHSTAAVDSKETFLAAMRSGAVQYRTMKRSDVKVRTYGCTVIITGRAEFLVSQKGQESPSTLRFHSVWVKRPGGLQFVSWQSTRVPAP